MLRVCLNRREPEVRTLEPNRKDPYRLREEVRPEIYQIGGLGGKAQSHSWNEKHLRKHYQ